MNVKILISPGYGAGWSTWNTEHVDFLLKDPTLVEMAERRADVADVNAYLAKQFPGEYFCTLGWRSISVVELPKGTQFQVTYAGSETISGHSWKTA